MNEVQAFMSMCSVLTRRQVERASAARRVGRLGNRVVGSRHVEGDACLVTFIASSSQSSFYSRRVCQCVVTDPRSLSDSTPKCPLSVRVLKFYLPFHLRFLVTMVQRHEDDDLIRRFSRVEQVRLERRRREKVEPIFVTPEILDGTDRCRRVLFEPDINLQAWIDGELGKIAENKKQRWNFDFQRGTPAGIPNHKWSWKKNVPRPPAPAPAPAPATITNTAAPKSSDSSSSRGKIVKRSPNERLQKKITREYFLNIIFHGFPFPCYLITLGMSL